MVEHWRARYPNDVTCVRCLHAFDAADLDRMLWCDGCRARARSKAALLGWVAGAILAGGLALYIRFVIQPSDLVIGGWIATVVAALWIGAKVAREIAYGVERFRNRKATDAVPPPGPG